MTWADLLKVVGALVVLLPAAYVTARLAGSRVGTRPGRAMRIVDALALGPGRSVYVVEVGTRLLVIGVSGQQMQTLACLDDPEEIAQVLRQARGGRAARTEAPGTSRERRAVHPHSHDDEPRVAS